MNDGPIEAEVPTPTVKYRPPETLPDGRRRYSNGTVYTPVADEDRKYRRRKPPGEGWLRERGIWYRLRVMAPLEARVLPETRPDDEAYTHARQRKACDCEVCARPQAAKYYKLVKQERRRARKLRRQQRQMRISSGPENASESGTGPPSNL